MGATSNPCTLQENSPSVAKATSGTQAREPYISRHSHRKQASTSKTMLLLFSKLKLPPNCFLRANFSLCLLAEIHFDLSSLGLLQLTRLLAIPVLELPPPATAMIPFLIGAIAKIGAARLVDETAMDRELKVWLLATWQPTKSAYGWRGDLCSQGCVACTLYTKLQCSCDQGSVVFGRFGFPPGSCVMPSGEAAAPLLRVRFDSS